MTGFDPRDMDDRERDRWDDLERGREPRDRDEERELDDGGDGTRDVFTRHLDLPEGRERELVRVHEHVYDLNGDDARALANIGAFRVVQARDLIDLGDDDARGRDTLDHLKDEGLVQVIPMERRDRDIVALTPEGRELLVEHRRDDDREHQQEFCAEAVKPRELTHDARLQRLSADGRASAGRRRAHRSRRPRLRAQTRVSDVPARAESRPVG
jgi:DNA-binding PadR family transcriptional regulator